MTSTTEKTTRRQMLKRATKTSLLLAAAQGLSPFLLSGCGSRGDKGGGGDKIKVGILHSLTGTMAISETSLKDVELMAIEEINKSGGVLGKQVEAIVEDPQSKFTDVFPEKAKKLLLKDKVAAVFGCWTSVSRKNVLPVFEENNGLLFYPAAVRRQRVLQERGLHGCRSEPADAARPRLAPEQGGRPEEEILPAWLRLRLSAHGQPDHRQVPRDQGRSSRLVKSTRRWATWTTPTSSRTSRRPIPT